MEVDTKNDFPAVEVDKPGDKWRWVAASDGYIPDGALLGGEDVNGEPLFVCRSLHAHKGETHKLPGKLVPTHKVCYVAFKGKEIAKRKYQVLVAEKGLKWKDAPKGRWCENAVIGGEKHSGEPLLIGRTWYHSTHTEPSLVIGYFDKEETLLRCPFGGNEITSHNYEYLALESDDN
ncbi:uncharacterized protein B4U80_08191 [Leptotrombidium deliense]|uniref:Natterin-3-like protein n=1 Tax=Leptotrombidium deliense TaxID=299467 RepID=A0A443SM26_9ACAR|nr:uncharacterized protein B4U80_08191 [Leptotrombidium deliense]